MATRQAKRISSGWLTMTNGDVTGGSTRIAGLGVMESMRDARQRMHEYELQAAAEYVFGKHGSYGPAHFALVDTGHDTFDTRFHAKTVRSANGDFVRFDCAPYCRNYAFNATGVSPADGKLMSWPRELCTVRLRLHQALPSSIRMYATPPETVADAVVTMHSMRISSS